MKLRTVKFARTKLMTNRTQVTQRPIATMAGMGGAMVVTVLLRWIPFLEHS